MLRFLTAAFLALALVPGAGKANTILSNLGATEQNVTSFGQGIATNFPKFAGWTMPGLSHVLDLVTLSLSFDDQGIMPVVTIVQGPTGDDGALLTALANPNFTSSGFYNFTPTSKTVLEAGETYWLSVVATDLNSPRFGWLGGDAAPTGLATFEGYFLNRNESSVQNIFAVKATPIPLPAGGLLLFAGLGGLLVLRRSRRDGA